MIPEPPMEVYHKRGGGGAGGGGGSNANCRTSIFDTSHDSK